MRIAPASGCGKCENGHQLLEDGGSDHEHLPFGAHEGVIGCYSSMCGVFIASMSDQIQRFFHVLYTLYKQNKSNKSELPSSA